MCNNTITLYYRLFLYHIWKAFWSDMAQHQKLVSIFWLKKGQGVELFREDFKLEWFIPDSSYVSLGPESKQVVGEGKPRWLPPWELTF